MCIDAHGATTTLAITQVWQHKNTTMSCTATGGTNTIHATDHAVNPPPGGPHCGYYCAPASISMYALYRGKTGILTQQDQIYDNGKFTQGEAPGDGIIQTHGFGMFSAPVGGVGGPEVQAAFAWSVGTPVEWGTLYGLPLTGKDVIALIVQNKPILWADHGGYPAEVNPPLPQEWIDVNGHAKIIAGYDDKGTAAYSDDEYLIYDPWPTSGSPYWLAQSSVLDTKDLYITDGTVIPTNRSSVGELKSKYGGKE
jgi:hypothetical protein